MRIVQINATSGIGSTGKICLDISRFLDEKGIENYIICSKSNGKGIACAEKNEVLIQAVKSRFLGNYGFNSKKQTSRIIAHLDRIQPDIVHLHNIHGHDCDLETLFSYFKKNKTKLIWTFHDCWAFTGYCPHFDFVKCDKWKDGCKDCPQRARYSLFFDRSSELYNKKRRLFSGLDMTVVTPSDWLASKVKESFLQDYTVKVINNGIDLNIFKPTQNEVKKNCGISDNKHLILGVSFGWEQRKGIDVFIRLANALPKDKYQIVLVGTDEKTDVGLPDNIISVHRTESQAELAEIYTAADVFVNPTREENYPTVNMEAIACGTPVVTFNTGGSREILNETCGSVVDKDDIEAMMNEIIRVCEERPYTKEDCLKRALAFDKNIRYREYLKLYEET